MARIMVKVMMAVAVVAGLVPATLGKQYMVGDDRGWTLSGVDYKAWAHGKHFVVGDSLVFNYHPGSHNVMIVNETNYEDCTRPLSGPLPLISGKDEVKLTTPGKKWYICGAPGHCSAGQKLAIDVADGAGAAAPPSVEPSSPKSSVAPSVEPSSPKSSAAAGGIVISGGFVVIGIVAGMMQLF